MKNGTPLYLDRAIHLNGDWKMCLSQLYLPNIGEIHYHKENKTNEGKQIEFSVESNYFEKKNQKWE